MCVFDFEMVNRCIIYLYPICLLIIRLFVYKTSNEKSASEILNSKVCGR